MNASLAIALSHRESVLFAFAFSGLGFAASAEGKKRASYIFNTFALGFVSMVLWW